MSITLEIKVIPQSGKQNIAQNSHGIIQCHLKSAPEKGKANQELIKFLSKKLSIPQADIIIARGETSPKKILIIKGNLSREEVYQRLGLALQSSLAC